jgi:hypothetical protein
MKDIILATIPSAIALIIVALTYWKDIRSKRQQETYLRKQKFYTGLIKYIAGRNFNDGDDGGKQMVKFYNEAYLHASKTVISTLDEYFKFTNTHPTFPVCPRIELAPYLEKIIIACRSDLGLKNIQKIEAYKYIYKK